MPPVLPSMYAVGEPGSSWRGRKHHARAGTRRQNSRELTPSYARPHRPARLSRRSRSVTGVVGPRPARKQQFPHQGHRGRAPTPLVAHHDDRGRGLQDLLLPRPLRPQAHQWRPPGWPRAGAILTPSPFREGKPPHARSRRQSPHGANGRRKARALRSVVPKTPRKGVLLQLG